MLYYFVTFVIFMIVLALFLAYTVATLLQGRDRDAEEEGTFTVFLNKGRSAVRDAISSRSAGKALAKREPAAVKNVIDEDAVLILKLDRQRLELPAAEGSFCKIGTLPENDMVIPDVPKNGFCSRRHLEISFENGSFLLTNKSDNCTWVDGKMLAKDQTAVIAEPDEVHRIILSAPNEEDGCLVRAVLM